MASDGSSKRKRGVTISGPELVNFKRRPEPSGDPVKNGYLTKGIALFNAGLYDRAMRHFKTAISLCDCNREAKVLAARVHVLHSEFVQSIMPENCQCKDWAAALNSLNHYALYRLAVAQHAPGCSRKKCEAKNHLVSLQYIYDIAVKNGRHEEARRFAESMIDMVPAKPEGYIALAAHYQGKKPKVEPAVVRIYMKALRIVQAHGDMSSKLSKRLFGDVYDYVRRDPVEVLPTEILHMIFSYLSLKEKYRCMRQGPKWMKLIRDCPLLWQVLHFSRTMDPGAKKLSDIMVKYAAQRCVEIKIEDAHKFRLTFQKLKILTEYAPKLEYLELRSSTPHPFDGELTSWTPYRNTFVCLNTLILDQIICTDFTLLSKILNQARSLKNLEIVGIPHMRHDWSLPIMPRLRCLRIVGEGARIPKNPIFKPAVDLGFWIRVAPNLRQLNIDRCILHNSSFADTKDGWPRLAALVIGSSIKLKYDYEPIEPVFPVLPPCIQHIDILAEGGMNDPLWQDLFMPLLYPRWCVHGEVDIQKPLVNIRYFRCFARIGAPYLASVLRASREAGHLRSLDLDCGGNSLEKRLADGSFSTPEHNRGVEELGINSYEWRGEDFAEDFLEWINLFPDVRTVCAYPDNPNMVKRLVDILLDLDGVEEIYQNGLFGVDWDHYIGRGGREGVTINQTTKSYRHMPWPCVVNEDMSIQA